MARKTLPHHKRDTTDRWIIAAPPLPPTIITFQQLAERNGDGGGSSAKACAAITDKSGHTTGYAFGTTSLIQQSAQKVSEMPYEHLSKDLGDGVESSVTTSLADSSQAMSVQEGESGSLGIRKNLNQNRDLITPS
jgi:hypothetical protein